MGLVFGNRRDEWDTDDDWGSSFFNKKKLKDQDWNYNSDSRIAELEKRILELEEELNRIKQK